MLKITLIDPDAIVLAKINENMKSALFEINIQASIICISEPPYIARENLLGKVPVIEIDNHYWSLKSGMPPTKAECMNLLLFSMQGE